MISQEITPFIRATAVIVLVSTIYSLVFKTFSSVYLLAWIVVIIIHQIVLELQLVKSAELRQDRNNWLRGILLAKIGHSPGIEHYISHITETEADFRARELGKATEKSRRYYLPPDVATAESEIIKLEERSSIVLTAAVFIPVVFSLAHLFRSVPPELIVVEIVIALTLTQTLALYYSKAIRLKGWTEALEQYKMIIEELISDGRKALFSIPQFYQNITEIEIAQEPTTNNKLPAYTAIGTTALVISKLSSDERPRVIKEFIQGTQSLPVKEELMEVRWRALSGRALLITTIGVAITAMFAGIASFSFPIIFEQVQTISPSQNLSVFLFLLVLPSSLIITQAWLNQRLLLRWGVIWTVTYWITFTSIQLFVY